MREETFTCTDGVSVFARRWEPAGRARGCVLCLHGVESHSAWFDEVAPHLVEQRYAVYAYDRPGWGQSEGTRGHLASYNDAVGQLSEIATALRREYGRLHLAGLSWGGLFALYATLRRMPLFDSLTLIAPGIIPLKDLGLLRKLQVGVGIASGHPEKMVPLAIRTADFTARPDRTAWIENDPHRTRAVSASFCLETLKMRKFVGATLGKRLLPPSTLLLAEKDVIIDNAATAATLSRDRVHIRRYKDAAHSLVFEAPREVAGHILENAAHSEPEATGRHTVIMGAGAVGSTVGGLLAMRGHSVTLIGRQAHADAVNRDGLRLGIGRGERTIDQHLVAVTEAAKVSATADLIVFSVKSFDLGEALEQVRPLIRPNTVLLSLQNGTDNEKRIAECFPGNTVLGGAICAYLDFAGPGHVVWSDDRGGLAGGLHQGDEARAFLAWRGIARHTGMECVYADSGAASVKWSKLMLNVAFNALNAVTGLSTAEILAHGEYGMLAVQALKEGFAVMDRLCITQVDLPGYPVLRMRKLCRLPDGIVRKVLAFVTRRETKTVSSMAQDLRKKRGSTEIDEINGAVVRGGDACGYPTPANTRLCAMVSECAES